MNEPIIKTDKLSCQIGRRYLLREIDWQVQRGEHWVIFGMNGSGKTTLLSIIAGFKKNTHGQVAILGEAYDAHNVLRLRQHIGLVSSSLFDKYFVHESILSIVLSGLYGTFGLNHRITDSQVILVKALLNFFDLADKLDYPYKWLSKGERQNVLIARALINEPDILILDEPCSGLDIYGRAQVFGMIQELAAKTQTTLIYVTHYTEEIPNLFQNCLLLKQGRIYAQGPTAEMLSAQRLSAFLGYPIEVTVQNGQTHVRLQADSHITALFPQKEAQP